MAASLIDSKMIAKMHHGDVVDGSGIFPSLSKIQRKDADMLKDTVSTYYSNWDDRTDITKSEEGVKVRRANAQVMTNAFYDLVTDFYEYGWGSSFHFAKMYKGDTFEANTTRHESYLAVKLGIKKTDKVLDVGCGVGGPLREVIKVSGGAHVTGINNNDYQLERCAAYSIKFGLSDFSKFIKGDFLDMPFADASFDAVFSVEATIHSPKLEMVYAEIFRILRPGGKYACYEWCVTDTYDENDQKQKKIIHGIEEGNSISKMYGTGYCLKAVRSVGFNVLEAEDLALMDSTCEPWYTSLSNATGIRGFARSPVGRVITHITVSALQAIGIAPPGTKETSQLLNDAADRLVEGGETGIFTPMYFFLAQKPSN